MYTHRHIYIYIYIYTHIHIHIYIHAHTHIHIGRALLHGHVGVNGKPEDGGGVARGDRIDDAHVVGVPVIINENDM